MNLLDIIIIAVLAFYMISGMYRGLITSGLSMFGFFGAWIGAERLYTRVSELALSNKTLMAVLTQYLEPESFFKSHTQAVTAVSDVVANGEAAIQNAVGAISQNLSIISDAFEFNVRSQMFQNLGINTLAEYLDQTIWLAIFNVASFVLCFIALYVLISLVVNLLDHVICWPIFMSGPIDSIFGGIFGLVRGMCVTLVIILLVPSLVSVISPEFSQALVSGSGLYSTIAQMDFGNKISSLLRLLIGG